MATLPTPGSDNGSWGDELNTWLETDHSLDATHRDTMLANKLGYKGYPSPPHTSVSISPTAGDFRGIAVPIRKGDVITTLAFGCTTVATSPTLCRLAVYDTSYNLVASTPNDTALVSSTGMKTKNLSSAYTATQDQLMYLGIIVVGSAFGSILGHSSNSVTWIAQSGFPRAGIYQTSLSDLPNPVVPVVPGSNNAMPWMAWM